VRWAHRPVEIILVARDASRGGRNVVVLEVTLGAGHVGMTACQGIVRVDGVVKFGVAPVHRRVAYPAIARQGELHVVGVFAVDEVRLVARIALRRRALEDIVEMAGDAGQRGVSPGERIAGVLR